MKEAIGGVSIFQIAVLFLLIFTGVMCLTINHSKAFGVKDEIINILEQETIASYGTVYNYEISDTSINKIVEHLNNAGYRITDKCPSGEWVGYDRNGNIVTNKEAAFCIRATNVHDTYHSDAKDKCKNNNCITTSDDFPSMIYYDVILFYQLDVPVLKEVMNFKMYGSTKVIFG